MPDAEAIESREALAKGPERPRATFWRRDEFGVEALMSMNWFKCVCDWEKWKTAEVCV